MKIMNVLALTSCLIMAVSACTKHEPIPRPVMHVNSAPTERFEITVRIYDDAASPERLFGKSTYAVGNPKECLPLDYTRALGGVRPELYHEQAQVYEKVGTRAFRTYVYEDTIIDEDYYEMGLCDWGVRVVTAKGMLGHPSQSVALTRGDILNGRGVFRYCPDKRGLDMGEGWGCISEEIYLGLDVSVRNSFKKIEIRSRKASI